MLASELPYEWHMCARRERKRSHQSDGVYFSAIFFFRIHILHRIYLSFERVGSTSFQMDTSDDTHRSHATKWDVKSVF